MKQVKMTALLLTLAFVLGTMVPAGGYLQNLDEPGIEWTEGNGTAYEWLDSYPELYDYEIADNSMLTVYFETGDLVENITYSLVWEVYERGADGEEDQLQDSGSETWTTAADGTDAYHNGSFSTISLVAGCYYFMGSLIDANDSNEFDTQFWDFYVGMSSCEPEAIWANYEVDGSTLWINWTAGWLLHDEYLNYTVVHTVYDENESAVDSGTFEWINPDDDGMKSGSFEVSNLTDGCYEFTVHLYQADDFSDTSDLDTDQYSDIAIGSAYCGGDEYITTTTNLDPMNISSGGYLDGSWEVYMLVDGDDYGVNLSIWIEDAIPLEGYGYDETFAADSTGTNSGIFYFDGFDDGCYYFQVRLSDNYNGEFLDEDGFDFSVGGVDCIDDYERTFICGNGDEIPFEMVNDNYEDCTDGSDEQQFDATTGEKINWYDCEDGTTEVWIEQVNDGEEDCPDGDDEYYGDDYFSPEELVEMFDANGDGELSLEEIFDGINELNNEEGWPPLSDEEKDLVEDFFTYADDDGSGFLDLDELEYFIELIAEEWEDDGPTFVCGDGAEIPFEMVNDNYEDCSDGSDEQQFDAAGVRINWFDCHDGSEVWIDQVNDGIEDCPDGEDEGNDYDEGLPSPEELLYMFDADGDGHLSLDELVNGINAHNNESGEPPMSEEEEDLLENGFNMADADGNGLLDIYELEDLIDMWEDEGGDPDFTYGDASLDATTYVMSPDYDATMMCEGGVGLMTAADFYDWMVFEDDPEDYLTWGTDHHTAGNVVDDTAPEGEYVVLAVLECMDLSGVHWTFGGYDRSAATGAPVMHTFTNGSTTTVDIYLIDLDDVGGGDGGDEDYFDCESGDDLSITFAEVTDATGTLTFTAVCTLSAENSEYVRGMIDEAGDNDGTVSTTELAAFMVMMAGDNICHAENGTEIPCEEGDDGVFKFDGVEIDAMNDVAPETISGVIEGEVITMTSTDVITLVLDPAVDTHTLTYQSTDTDGGDDDNGGDCSGSVSIDSVSPWTTTSVTFNPSDDWDVEHLADGTWLVSNMDSDSDGECNSEPTSVEIVWTRPVIDTTPVCDIYYHVGGAVLTAGSTWSVQLQGAVSFEVPSDGEFTLALPVGSYSVILACNDAEGDEIDVMVTVGTETREGTAQNGVIYVEALFEITEDNVGDAVDITLLWESTAFGGTFNIHFTAVESIADAIEDSDTGGLPGFTSVVTITAMLGAAMILARRKD